MHTSTAQSGFADVLIGTQFGDEGKAKAVDHLAAQYDVVARYNGGNNAGHTIDTHKGRFALHQVPSGVIYDHVQLYIGSGCVVNPAKLLEEISSLEKVGVSVRGRLTISPFASIIQPSHILEDGVTGGAIGTTKSGIGPAYADRARRTSLDGQVVNLRAVDLLNNPGRVQESARASLAEVISRYSIPGINQEEMMRAFREACDGIREFVTPSPTFLVKKADAGSKILFEGAQAALLDVTSGTVPFVTSSSTVAGAAFVGGDLPPRYHRRTIGVAKLIMSRVGNGPFVSEFGGRRSEEYCDGKAHTRSYEESTYPDPRSLLRSGDPFEVGVALRMLGGEYGSTTGRPRRMGSFDLESLEEISRMNAVDALYLTKADLLTLFSETLAGTIPVTSYYDRVGTSEDSAPRPIVEHRVGFNEDITGVRSIADLPSAMQDLIDMIEQRSGAKVEGVGVGPKREQLALRS